MKYLEPEAYQIVALKKLSKAKRMQQWVVTCLSFYRFQSTSISKRWAPPILESNELLNFDRMNFSSRKLTFWSAPNLLARFSVRSNRSQELCFLIITDPEWH